MLLSGKNSLIKDLTNKNVTMTSRDNCLNLLFRAVVRGELRRQALGLPLPPRIWGGFRKRDGKE